MATYLITGAFGFIGSNVVHHLLEAEPDARVISVDNEHEAWWTDIFERKGDLQISWANHRSPRG